VILYETHMPSVVTRNQAVKSLLTHGFQSGVGYVDYGASLRMPLHPQPGGNDCLPVRGTLDGSYHMLKVGASIPMPFVWVAKERAWGRMGGHRLAFTPEYLSHNGWSYVRPATPQDMTVDVQRGAAIQFNKSIMRQG
jgi:hypothetical protein